MEMEEMAFFKWDRTVLVSEEFNPGGQCVSQELKLYLYSVACQGFPHKIESEFHRWEKGVLDEGLL